ncbi:hypothetical protein PoB_006222800 [Plakobranchus ocellatus]|uniref:Uncharacterized protein n=1 Tax=Plakobranchus ocellatus TaxID=259542 RepID=A0AAV4CV27_9GAST|nr:hypothetical protein PoB_006222800 [Plakobranchus ocellatus]
MEFCHSALARILYGVHKMITCLLNSNGLIRPLLFCTISTAAMNLSPQFRNVKRSLNAVKSYLPSIWHQNLHMAATLHQYRMLVYQVEMRMTLFSSLILIRKPALVTWCLFSMWIQE